MKEVYCMKKGIFYNNVYSCPEFNEDISEMMKFLQENEIEGIQFDINELKNVSSEEMLSNLEKYNCKAVCIHIVCHLTSADESLFKQAVKECEAAMKTAQKYGCKSLMVVPSYPEDINGKEDMPRAKRRMAQGLKILTEIAPEYGVSVYIENYSLRSLPFSLPEDILYFMDSVPNLKYNFDTGNFVYAGCDSAESLKSLSKYVKMVHVKDCLWTDCNNQDCDEGKNVVCVPFGEGEAKLSEVLPILNTVCPEDTYFVIETHAEINSEAIVRESKYLNNILMCG